ncbi:MAG: ABC transporter ATP-binding protein [Myxococcota bacterium]
MIQVEDLKFSYPGADRPALSNVSFTVQAGEVFGLLGPSGAGKSTTQNVLIRLLRGYDGTVQIMQRSLDDWGAEYYRQIGVSFESPNHYLKLTARENLDYFRALYGRDTVSSVQMLQWVGLQDDIDRPVSDFSKGMKNRLNIARSLLHRPRLWFLDEPTAGLDPVNARRIQDLIRSQQGEGTTVFLTTHNMQVAETLCDRVGFMIDGRLELVDAPARLRQQHGRREVEVAYGDTSTPTVATFALDGLADNAEFCAALRRDDLLSLHSQETSLEDVFIRVTGRSLT